MKLPKNRQTLYTVVRLQYDNYEVTKTLIDTYSSYEVAKDAADGYEQDMKDRGLPQVKFGVESSTYYVS